jgi:hypothetical protein
MASSWIQIQTPIRPRFIAIQLKEHTQCSHETTDVILSNGLMIYQDHPTVRSSRTVPLSQQTRYRLAVEGDKCSSLCERRLKNVRVRSLQVDAPVPRGERVDVDPIIPQRRRNGMWDMTVKEQTH